MADDIVARLRERTDPSMMLMSYPPEPAPDRLCHEAADKIERLRAALEELIVAVDYETPPIAAGHEVHKRSLILMRCANEARAALAGEKSDD